MNYLYYEEFFNRFTGSLGRSDILKCSEQKLKELGYDQSTIAFLNERGRYDDAIGNNRWCHIEVSKECN